MMSTAGEAAAPRPAARPGKGVRACRRDDLPRVAALYEAVMRSGKRTPAPRLAEYFERTFFDCPWADAEIPSLVYEDDAGCIIGFLGSHVRRLRLDGRTLRIACGGQLVADPQARAPVGAILFRTHLRGPQAATFTDGANETVRRMWEVCGGEAAHLKTIAWTRILRPARYAGDYALRRLGRPAAARALRPLWRPLDALAVRLAGRRLRPPARASAEGLDARAVMDHLPLVTELLRGYPDYDEAFLEWLFREMAAVKSRGTLVRSLVRDGRGQALGWYVYYLEGGVAHAFQVAAKRGAAGEVLDALFHHAFENGAAAVHGRLEPQLAGALAARRCVYGWSGGALLHSTNPALLGVLLSSQCWLGLMDGESWMGHHRENFT